MLLGSEAGRLASLDPEHGRRDPVDHVDLVVDHLEVGEDVVLVLVESNHAAIAVEYVEPGQEPLVGGVDHDVGCHL